MGFLDDIRHAIDTGIEMFGSKKALAQASGIGAPNLTRWSQETTPSVDTLAPLMDVIGARVVVDKHSRPAEYAYIPKVSARAGAGSSLETDSGVEGYYAFRREFLARMGIYEKEAVLFMVTGRSMTPVLQDNDIILVDTQDNQPKDGHIYLIGMDDELLVKYLIKIVGGWCIKSQNPEYPDINLTGESTSTLRVYGRVRWVGRSL